MSCWSWAAMPGSSWPPDADVAWAAARCAWGAYYLFGAGVHLRQRILVEAPVYEDFKAFCFWPTSRKRVVGDLAKDETDRPADRRRPPPASQAWIEEAIDWRRASCLAGGPRQGTTIPATLMENAPASCKLSCEGGLRPRGHA